MIKIAGLSYLIAGLSDTIKLLYFIKPKKDITLCKIGENIIRCAFSKNIKLLSENWYIFYAVYIRYAIRDILLCMKQNRCG